MIALEEKLGKVGEAILVWMTTDWAIGETKDNNQLHNCIYLGRKKALHPSIEVFKALIRDELKHKFKGKGDIDKCKNEAERTALQWLRVEMGWTLP